jgi:mono/diheme cytochrome c family protein
MSANRRLLQAAVVTVAAVMTSGCSWFTAFVVQPKLDPWKIVGSITTPSRGNPQNSVPITGTYVANWQVSHTAAAATIDSMSGIQNPTAPDSASLVNGRKLFTINCMPCHGAAAKGDGPVTKYGVPGISLVFDMTKNRTDGYIFGMIRNGRGFMPSYDRIEESERWDIVNYLRGLQGKYPVPVGPVGYPGQTGDALPHYTTTAPTRPVPVGFSTDGAFGADSTHAIKNTLGTAGAAK